VTSAVDSNLQQTVELVCEPGEQLVILIKDVATGHEDRELLQAAGGIGNAWNFDARTEPSGKIWRTSVTMLDIVYDTKFDIEDVLEGIFFSFNSCG